MNEGFKHSCFISYRNGNHEDSQDLLNNFARQIYEALDSELRTQLDDAPIFWDVKSLKGGYILNPTIAGAICGSVCLIVIFTRNYLSEKKLFCASELYGMLHCETKRLEILNAKEFKKGMIITIVLRNPNLVPKILKDRLFYDFSKFTLAEADIRVNPNYNDKIREIAEYIAEWYEEMKPLENEVCSITTNFKLPDIDLEHERQTIIDFINQQRMLYNPKLQQS